VDGAPIRFCSVRFHNFVYADYSVERSVLEATLASPGLRGYQIAESMEIPAVDLFGVEWPEFMTMHSELIRRVHFPHENPYAHFIRFERKEGFHQTHGPADIHLLFIKAEAIATYRSLFVRQKIAPACVAYIRSGIGFGGNYSEFPDKLMKELCRPPGPPSYLLYDHFCSPGTGDYMPLVEDYTILVQGFGSGALRFAERTTKTDDHRLRASTSHSPRGRKGRDESRDSPLLADDTNNANEKNR